MFPLLILINLIPVGSQSICILEDLRGIDAVIRSDSSIWTLSLHPSYRHHGGEHNVTRRYWIQFQWHWAESTGADDFEKAVQDAAVEFQESYVS